MKRAKAYKYLYMIWLVLGTSLTRLDAQIDVEHVISIGRNALHFNDYVVSIGYFNQAIDARPWMALPYYYRAVAKINLEDYSGAASDASLCLERNQFISKAYLVRGIARQNMGLREEAISDYIKGLEFAPSDLGMNLNLALSYSQKKAYEDAERCLSRLLGYHPRSAEAYQLRANIALEQGDTISAIHYADKATQLDSLQAMPYRLRAHIYAEQERIAESLQELSRAINLEPRDAQLLATRGILYYRSNKLRQAMQDYSEALKLEPRHRVARYNRALLRTLVGELELALDDWDLLLAQESNNHIARYNRAILNQKVGRSKEAIRDLNIVLAQYPSFIEGYWLRAQLRKTEGDNKGAERDYWHAWDLQQNKQYRAKAHKQAIANHRLATRSAQDTEIDKYALLIEEQPSLSDYKPKYSNAARGRVQDRDTQVSPNPAYYLTYFSPISEEGKPESKALPTTKLIEDEDKLARQAYKLKLHSQPYALGEAEIQALKEIIKHSSERERSKHSYLHQGLCYTLLQDYDQAIERLGLAIELDKGYALAYLARAVALERKYTVEQVESTPKSTSSLGGEGLIGDIKRQPLLPTTKGLGSALEDLNKAIALAPDLSPAYYNRGVLYAKMNNISAAIADYTTAIKLSPRMAEAYFNRGLLLLSQQRSQESITDLSKAGELGLYTAYNIIKRISKD